MYACRYFETASGYQNKTRRVECTFPDKRKIKQ